MKDVLGIISKFVNNGEGLEGGERLVEDLGLDSLDVMELILSVENETHVRVKNSRIRNISTVSDLARLFA